MKVRVHWLFVVLAFAYPPLFVAAVLAIPALALVALDRSTGYSR